MKHNTKKWQASLLCITPVSYTHLDVYKRQVADIRTAGYLPSEEKNAGTGTEASGFAAEDDRGGRRLSLCDRKRYL